jgi:hypothetical protein
MGYDKITVLIHRVAGYDPGQEVQVEVDESGTPINQFWRRRLRDSERDQCCKVVTEAKDQESRDLDIWEEEQS